VVASSERPIQVPPGELGNSGDDGTRFGDANPVASGDGKRARQKRAARERKAAARAAAAPQPPAKPRRISDSNKVPLSRRVSGGGGARELFGPSSSLGPQPLANFCWRCEQVKDLVNRAGGA
jgi:hypothetical protein